jgi:hypothetical protein
LGKLRVRLRDQELMTEVHEAEHFTAD